MLVENVFDFHRRNIFPAGNDDVLGAILDDDIAVLVEHPEVSGVKPSAGKGLTRGLFVLEIALHHDVAAEHDLADGLAVARHLTHGGWIEDGHRFLERVGDTLPTLELRALV